MKLEDFFKEVQNSYTFYRDDEIDKRGYAICYDAICTIYLNDKKKEYNLVREAIDNDGLDIYFNNIDELLDYKIEGKTIKEYIQELPELFWYHISMVGVDEKGNISGEYIPYECGNIKDYVKLRQR